jgi:hypothetical protein
VILLVASGTALACGFLRRRQDRIRLALGLLQLLPHQLERDVHALGCRQVRLRHQRQGCHADRESLGHGERELQSLT